MRFCLRERMRMTKIWTGGNDSVWLWRWNGRADEIYTAKTKLRPT